MSKTCFALKLLVHHLQASPRYTFTSSIRTSLDVPPSHRSSLEAAERQGQQSVTGQPSESNTMPASQLRPLSPQGSILPIQVPPNGRARARQPAGFRALPASAFGSYRDATQASIASKEGQSVPTGSAAHASQPPQSRNAHMAEEPSPHDGSDPQQRQRGLQPANTRPAASSTEMQPYPARSEGMTVIPLDEQAVHANPSMQDRPADVSPRVQAAIMPAPASHLSQWHGTARLDAPSGRNVHANVSQAALHDHDSHQARRTARSQPGVATAGGFETGAQALQTTAQPQSPDASIDNHSHAAEASLHLAAEAAPGSSPERILPAAAAGQLGLLSRPRSSAATGPAVQGFHPEARTLEHASSSEGVAGTSEDEVRCPVLSLCLLVSPLKRF